MFQLKTVSAVILALAIGLPAAGCIDTTADDSVDPGDTSEVNQASVEYDQCAVGQAANARETAINVGDSYTRTAAEINRTQANGGCDCLDWQAEKFATSEHNANILYPRCRPATIVDYSLGVGSHFLNTRVDSWAFTSQTECENSLVTVLVEKFNSSTGQYEAIPGGTSNDLHPQFTGGVCRPVSFGATATVGVGGSTAFRVRATARRGLGENNHGFETVTITTN